MYHGTHPSVIIWIYNDVGIHVILQDDYIDWHQCIVIYTCSRSLLQLVFHFPLSDHVTPSYDTSSSITAWVDAYDQMDTYFDFYIVEILVLVAKKHCQHQAKKNKKKKIKKYAISQLHLMLYTSRSRFNLVNFSKLSP